MDVIISILQPISIAAGAITGTVSVAGLLTKYLRDWSKKQKTAQVLAFVKQLGLKSEDDVKEAVENWPLLNVGSAHRPLKRRKKASELRE